MISSASGPKTDPCGAGQAIAIPRVLTRRCECGTVATVRLTLTQGSADGHRHPEALCLCQSCYLLYLEEELQRNHCAGSRLTSRALLLLDEIAQTSLHLIVEVAYAA